MGNCSTCKHWGNTKYPGIYAQDGMKDCERLQGSGYVDTEGEPCTTSTIGTAPDFGCMLFEAKEPV